MGGFLCIHKNINKLLPKNREFTEAEALLSLTIDHAQGNTATLRGYAALWRWSTGRVSRFLKARGAALRYPEGAPKRNCRGTIVSTMPKQWRDMNDTILFIDYSTLKENVEQNRDNVETVPRHKRSATTKTKKEINKFACADGAIRSMDDFFENAWSHYPRKEGKSEARKHFTQTVRSRDDIHELYHAIDAYKARLKADNTDPKYVKSGGKFFGCWQDYIP